MLTKSERAAMQKSCEAFPYPDGVEDDLLRLLTHASDADEVIAGLVGVLRLALERSKATADRYTGYSRLTISLAGEEAEAFEAALADPRLAALEGGRGDGQ